MKQFYMIILLCLYFQCIFSYEVGDIIQLPEPQKDRGMTLNEALNNRKSSRDFDNTKKIDNYLLSQALWSCYGVYRPNGYRTTPSAVAWFPLIIYAFLEDGVYKYNPLDNTLTVVLLGDYRAKTGTQAYVAKAAVNFVVIADFKKKTSMDDENKKKYIYLDTGHCTMGFSLFAAANNMKGVDRAMVDIDPLLELLGLAKEDYVFTLSYSLGY